MKKNKNIYMGPRSTARLPVFGKVDTGNEICLNAVATAYDSLNGMMLTRIPGKLEKADLSTVNGRFSVLRMLCRKYSPSKLVIVDKIYNVVSNYFKGYISYDQAFMNLNNIIIQHNLDPGVLNIATHHIDQAEQIGMNFFDFLNKKNVKSKFRGKK